MLPVCRPTRSGGPMRSAMKELIAAPRVSQVTNLPDHCIRLDQLRDASPSASTPSAAATHMASMDSGIAPPISGRIMP